MHDGHTGRQGLNHIEAEGLAIKRRNREHREPAQESQLPRPIQVRMKFYFAQQIFRFQPLAQRIDEWLIRRPATAADAQLQVLYPPALAQSNERLHQRVPLELRSFARLGAIDARPL